jgi:hypothetical protein
MSLPATPGFSMHPYWPSLSVMLGGWLTEEVAVLRQVPQPVAPDTVESRPVKYPLNLSVAHLACLLNLFCSAKVPGNQNLTELFNFVTAHFSSKRQENISAKSLSKAYYSITQVSAANVQGLLQQMISAINRKYFPLASGLVTGLTLFLFAGK